MEIPIHSSPKDSDGSTNMSNGATLPDDVNHSKKISTKTLILAVGTVVFLILGGAAGAAYFNFTKNNQAAVETVAEENPSTVNSDQDSLAANEPESSGISDTQSPKPVVEPDPVVITPAPVVTETKPANAAPKAPANNKSPTVTVLSYYLEGFEHDGDKAVTIITRAEDSDGTIAKVEIYVDGQKEATITPYNIGGVEKNWLDDPEDIFDVEQAALEWTEDNTDDGDDMGYVYRVSREWTNSSQSCGIPRGYSHIILGEHNIYDVRTARDLEKHVICKKSDSIGIDDLFYYMWDPSGGTHETYAIAYDKYGASTKSDTVEFEVE